MHIQFFSHYFPPEGNAPASRTYENCKRWVRQGHSVRVITCAPNAPAGEVYNGYRNGLYQKEIIDGIEVLRVWTYIAANKGTVRRIINYVSYMVSSVFFSLFISRPDIIIATSPQFFCGWAGLISSRLRRVPFILEIRDIWPEGITAAGGMTKAKRLVNLVEYMALRLYKGAALIVTVGDGYRLKLKEKGVCGDKIKVITNGVDQTLFYSREPDRNLIRKYGLESSFVCSYIGTIGMACALSVVLRAAEILNRKHDTKIKFLLVGDGATLEDLKNEAKQKAIRNVIFTGRQDKSLMPDFLSLTDVCLVHLRKTELYKSVLPSKIFEAAGMAKPIILGVEGFAADLVKKANAGICIEPENEVQLVEVLEKLAGDPALCEHLGRFGRAYVIEHFDRETLAKNYLDLIEQVHKKSC